MRRTFARSNGVTRTPRDFAPVSGQASTRVARLLVRVRHVALRLLRCRYLLNLHQRVHDPRGGRPTGVTVRTATSRQRDVHAVLPRRQAETLTHDCARIEVVVIAISVHGSRQRRRAGFAVHLHFPTTPLATAYNAQVIVVQDARAR